MANTGSRQIKPVREGETNQGSLTSNLSQTLGYFLQSLGEVLTDVTALEVNTMVVQDIDGDKFIAWEAYRDIYPISEEYLERLNIHKSLRDRYIEIRKNLELEYTLLLTDPESALYEPAYLETVRGNNKIMTEPTVELDEIQTQLPDPLRPTNPAEILKAKRLLTNSRFLRSLRKMSELKAALDNRSKALHKKQGEQPAHTSSEVLRKAVKTDMIYAQTIIQLDGDVINRYSEDLFDHPHRELILQIHREGVTSGERQWRGLLKFVIGLVQSSLTGRSVSTIFPWNRDKQEE